MEGQNASVDLVMKDGTEVTIPAVGTPALYLPSSPLIDLPSRRLYTIGLNMEEILTKVVTADPEGVVHSNGPGFLKVYPH